MEQCIEFMAGRFESGLFLGQPKPEEMLDVKRKEEEADSYQWPAPTEGVGVVRRPIERQVSYNVLWISCRPG